MTGAALFALLYVALPTANHSGDALGYTAEFLRMEQGGTWHWSAHHLLYHPLAVLTHRLPLISDLGIMQWTQAVNAMAAGFSLWLMYLILRRQVAAGAALTGLMLAGSAFGVMRFATENETYVLPILFSLWGSLQLLKHRESGIWFQAVSGFVLLGTAVLFHQMHVWWLLAAAWACRRQTRITDMLPAAALVAIVYVLAARAEGQDWWKFPFHDALQGTVSLIPGLDNVKFTVINAVRTWVQMHGNIPWFLKASVTCAMLAGAGVALMLLAVLPLKFLRGGNKSETQGHPLFRVALVLHLLWAFYSVGNAEFMVMMPFLAPASFPALLQQQRKRLGILALGMLAWNTGSALLPNRLFVTDPSGLILEKISQLFPGDETIFYMTRNKVQMENYHDAMSATQGLKTMHKTVLLSAPSDRGPHTASEPDADSLIRAGKPVYTDCYDFPEPVSRSSVMAGETNKKVLESYLRQQVDSISYIYGKIRIYRLQKAD